MRNLEEILTFLLNLLIKINEILKKFRGKFEKMRKKLNEFF